MQAYSKFQRSYERAQKKELRDSANYKRQKDEMVQAIAPGIRDIIINDIRIGNPQRIEQLSFGLPFFGIVNCDFFYNNPPDNRLAMENELTDQDGRSIERPAFVRTVLPSSNVYLTLSSDQIPQYNDERTIVLMPLSDTELGIIYVDDLDSREKISTFFRADISGKTPEEIAAMISQL